MKPPFSKTLKINTLLPIDLHMAKAYVFADVRFNEPHWTRTFRTKQGLVVARTTQKTPLSTNLTLTIESEVELDEEIEQDIVNRIKYEIDADADLFTLREERINDILLEIAIKANPGFRLYANSNPTEVGVCAMLSQNTDMGGYLTLLEQFCRKYGGKVPWDKSLRVFPSKDQIAEMSTEDWEQFNIGFKAEFLGGLSKRDLENFYVYSYYPVYDRGLNGLKKINGVGEYTARIMMIYGARRYEKAILDGFVQEILNHKYKVQRRLIFSDFDNWINKRWENSPALIIHTHIQDYLPAAIRDFNFELV